MKWLLLLLVFTGIVYGKNPEVVLVTNFGEIKLELYPDKAPITVENFLTYVKEGFYQDTIFHRVIKGFMIQGGGHNTDFSVKTGHPSIKNEAQNGLKNERGALAMARTGAIDSASCQFFINTVSNEFLNYQGPHSYGYCVFGKVVSGMDVVDRITEVKTGNTNGFQDVPLTKVVIEKALLLTPA